MEAKIEEPVKETAQEKWRRESTFPNFYNPMSALSDNWKYLVRLSHVVQEGQRTFSMMMCPLGYLIEHIERVCPGKSESILQNMGVNYDSGHGIPYYPKP